MDLISKHVIPGNHGKVFSTDAEQEKDLLKIRKAIYKMDGVKDIIINMKILPREFTVYTSTLVQIKDVQNEVKRFGFHAIPKSLFKL